MLKFGKSGPKSGSDRPAITKKAIRTFKAKGDFESDIRISLKNKYVYAMVPKTASSTVTYHLQYAEFQGSKFSVGNVNKGIMSPHLLPYQLQSRDTFAILASDDFKKITFVRNPYTRLLSCYLHRIIGTKRSNPSKKALLKATGRSEFKDLQNVSFAEFIECICEQPSNKMERHWCVQHDSILYPLIIYDFIGKQENLIEDLFTVEKLLFGPRLLRSKPAFNHNELGSVNKSPMTTSSSAKLMQYYDDRLVAKVADRYKLDFETFGYSTDIRDAL
jgi:hypothetical protein